MGTGASGKTLGPHTLSSVRVEFIIPIIATALHISYNGLSGGAQFN